MTNEEMIEKLKLTTDQKKAFNRLKKALKDFESVGGVLVGNNDQQYALNGCNYVNAYDSYNHGDSENRILIDDAELDYVKIPDSFSDSSPYIEVLN